MEGAADQVWPFAALEPEGVSMSSFSNKTFLAKGTFSSVEAAQHSATGMPVALKYIHVASVDVGLPNIVLRELEVLRRLNGHENIVNYLGSFVYEKDLVVVTELAAIDLRTILKTGPQMPTLAAAKGLMVMLLRGMHFMHSNGFLHRDIKPGNLLIGAASGQLKIADFGLARVHSIDAIARSRKKKTLQTVDALNENNDTHGDEDNKNKKPAPAQSEYVDSDDSGGVVRAATPADAAAAAAATLAAPETVPIGRGVDTNSTAFKAGVLGGDEYEHQVATRWYRAPELLFAARIYGSGVDLWACGCIFAELLTGQPLFPGLNDIDQICRVTQVLGDFDETDWPELTTFSDYGKIAFQKRERIALERLFPNMAQAGQGACDLIQGLVALNPSRRPSALASLDHAFFLTEPTPTIPYPTRALMQRKRALEEAEKRVEEIGQLLFG